MGRRVRRVGAPAGPTGARRGFGRTLAGACAALALALAVAAAPGRAGAQVPGVLVIEARGGAAIGSYEVTRAGLEMAPGPAWGLAASWGPDERIGAYASYAAVAFGCEGGFCRGYDVRFTSRGFSVGIQGHAPVRGEPWARVGVLLHDFDQRWRGEDGPGEAEADAGAGVEAAVGLTWPLRDRLSLAPGVHLGLLPTETEGGASDRVFFGALEVGLRYRL